MSKSLKNLVFYSLDMSGLPNLFLKLAGNQPRIFLYHGVSPQIPNCGIFNYRQKFIRPESFRKHLIWLKKHFNIVPLSSIIERSDSKERITKPSCAITFDDGYENLYTHSFPILKELNVPATIFLTTDIVDKKTPLWVDLLEYALGMTEKPEIDIRDIGKTFSLKNYGERCAADDSLRKYLKKIPEEEKIKTLEEIIKIAGKDLRKDFASSPYRGLTWNEAREMEKYKIEFAPHTLTHPILSRLDKEAAEREIRESYTHLKTELKNPLPIFAYPNGQTDDFTDETIEILKNMGFTAALTTVPDTINFDRDLFRLPRFSLDGTDTMTIFRLTASGAKAYLRNIFTPPLNTPLSCRRV